MLDFARPPTGLEWIESLALPRVLFDRWNKLLNMLIVKCLALLLICDSKLVKHA